MINSIMFRILETLLYFSDSYQHIKAFYTIRQVDNEIRTHAPKISLVNSLSNQDMRPVTVRPFQS